MWYAARISSTLLLCTLQRLNDAREIMSLVLVVNTLLSISFFSLSLSNDISILSMIWQTDKEKKLAVFERNRRRKMKDIYMYTHDERKYVSHTRHLLHWISFQRRYMDRETCTNHCKTMARSFSLVSIMFSSCFLFFILHSLSLCAPSPRYNHPF